MSDLGITQLARQLGGDSAGFRYVTGVVAGLIPLTVQLDGSATAVPASQMVRWAAGPVGTPVACIMDGQRLVVVGRLEDASAQGNTDGLVYYGATTGWRLPWSQPWGLLVGVTTTGQAAFGIGGSGVATTANTDTQLDICASATMLKNRRYRVTATAQMYSPAGATDAVLRLQKPGPATIAQAEQLPSTTTGEMVGPIVVEYDQVTTDLTGSWRTLIFFSGATGFVLQDNARFSNLLVEDIGPNGTAPTS